jgi:hypothetical protein
MALHLTARRSAGLVLSLLLAGPACAQSAPDYDGMLYDGMLSYLASSRIGDQAFQGANGALAVNMAAGDLNLQANLRGIANGGRASADLVAVQRLRGNRFDPPLHAVASIGDGAFAGASGMLSINQASGSANTELNTVAASLAQQGIREATDAALAASASSASAGGRAFREPSAPATGTRQAVVEATALEGFNGVMQLNQIAGSGNATSNQFGLSVQATP